jgi:hypothetical protein
MLHYITINTGAEILCFLVGLICIVNDKSTAWRVLVAYQLITCLVEFTGIYFRHQHASNAPVYNIAIVAECVTVSYFFYYLLCPYFKPLKPLVAWLVLFVAIYVYELLVISHFKYFVDITASVMSVAFVLASLIYYYQEHKAHEYRALMSSPEFWWVNGTLFFYFGSTVSNIFFQYLAREDTTFYLTARYIIFNGLNVVLYACWSYAFICRYRQRNFSISLS